MSKVPAHVTALHGEDLDDFTHVDIALLSAKYRLRRLFALLSLVLESFLSALLSVYSLFFPDEPLTTARSKSRPDDEDYWGEQPTKGDALVIWAATHDELARRFAIRLAAATPSSYAFSESGAAMRKAQRPYTCIVLLGDPAQLPVLVAEWAAKKAEVEAQWQTNNKDRWSTHHSPPYSPQQERSSSPPGGRRGGEPTAKAMRRARSSSFVRLSHRWRDWIPSNVVGFGIDTLKGWRIGHAGKPNVGSVIPIVADVSSAEGLAHAKSTVNAYCQLHNLILRGVIVVPSILGPRYVAESEVNAAMSDGVPLSPRATFASDPIHSPSAQAVSPLMGGTGGSTINRDLFGNPAEGSREGLWRRRSRRSADREAAQPSAQVLSLEPQTTRFSAVDASNEGGPTSEGSDLSSPPMSPTTERASRRQNEELNTLRAAIKTDLGDSAALVNALFPLLKKGKGRVLALVPSGFGVDLPDDVEFLERFGERRDVVLSHLASESDRGHAGESSPTAAGSMSGSRPSAKVAVAPVADAQGRCKQAWPPSTRTTVREALETMWTSLTPSYAHSGIAITLIQTPSLLSCPVPSCPQPQSEVEAMAKYRRKRRGPERLRPRPWTLSPSWWFHKLSQRGRLKLADKPPYRGWFGPPSYAPYLAPLRREFQQASLSEYAFAHDFLGQDKGSLVLFLRKLARYGMGLHSLMSPFDSLDLPPAPVEPPRKADTKEDEDAFLERHSRKEWKEVSKLAVLESVREQKEKDVKAAHAAWEAVMAERRRNDALLFEVVRKALVDRPRRWYPVGLAARVDAVVGAIPGVKAGKRWLKETIDY